MRYLKSLFLCLIFLLMTVAPAWTLTISLNNQDVGSLDTLLAQADLGNSDEDAEAAWASSILGFEVSVDYKLEQDLNELNWYQTVEEPTYYAQDLGGAVDYYIIKTGNLSPGNTTPSTGNTNTHFLYDNLDDLYWAVIDFSVYGSFMNVGKISHVTNFEGGDGSTAVPEPGTMALLGIGLLGFAGMARKKD